MNTVNVIGNICKDVTTESSTSGTTYLRNSIAVRRDKDNSDFFNIIAFGKCADFISKYFSKGSKIAITGHLQSDSYTNKEGKKTYSVSIVVDKADFCESKSNDNSNDFLNVTNTEDLPFS